MIRYIQENSSCLFYLLTSNFLHFLLTLTVCLISDSMWREILQQYTDRLVK